MNNFILIWVVLVPVGLFVWLIYYIADLSNKKKDVPLYPITSDGINGYFTAKTIEGICLQVLGYMLLIPTIVSFFLSKFNWSQIPNCRQGLCDIYSSSLTFVYAIYLSPSILKIIIILFGVFFIFYGYYYYHSYSLKKMAELKKCNFTEDNNLKVGSTWLYYYQGLARGYPYLLRVSAGGKALMVFLFVLILGFIIIGLYK